MDFNHLTTLILNVIVLVFFATTVRRHALLTAIHPLRSLATNHALSPPYAYLVLAGTLMSSFLYMIIGARLRGESTPEILITINSEELKSAARILATIALITAVVWVTKYYQRFRRDGSLLSVTEGIYPDLGQPFFWMFYLTYMIVLLCETAYAAVIASNLDWYQITNWVCLEVIIAFTGTVYTFTCASRQLHIIWILIIGGIAKLILLLLSIRLATLLGWSAKAVLEQGASSPHIAIVTSARTIVNLAVFGIAWWYFPHFINLDHSYWNRARAILAKEHALASDSDSDLPDTD